MNLSGNVLEFGDPGEIIIIGIVDHAHRLVSGYAGKVFMLESQGAIG